MHLLRLLTLLSLFAVAALAQTPPAPFNPPFEPDPEVLAAPDVETAWKPIAQMSNMDYLMEFLASAKGEERQAKVRELMLRSLRVSLAFYQKYPSDPRRWNAVRDLSSATLYLANPDGTAKAPIEGFAWDHAAWATWIPQIKALDAQIATAPDAPSIFKLTAETQKAGGLAELGKAVSKALAAKEPVDFGPFKAEFLRLVAAYPEVPTWAQYTANYVRMRSQAGATKESLLAELQELSTNSSAVVSKAAKVEIEKITLAERPIEIAFTAVDGTKIDLKNYRGKVVLVDFWATWCGPCIREIPNIKKVYAAYHDKGFEIIGISLENARLSSKDTPEQTEAKHVAARQILNDFTTKTEMPWPQYYDGKFWKNDISTRFEIASIPAMFLIDQNGMLVSREARGEKLEAEVKRLLKL